LKGAYDTSFITAIGYLSGEIVQIGPEYTSLVTSAQAEQDWFDCWEDSYQRSIDFGKLRRINERYMARILDFEDSELARIRTIQRPGTVAWRIAQNKPQTSHSVYESEYNKIRGKDSTLQDQSEGPKICLCTRDLIALVPSAARVGDVIVRFWGCNSTIVMRPVDPPTWQSEKENKDRESLFFILVGRSDAIEDIDFPQELETLEQRWLSPDPGSVPENGIQEPGAVCIDLNLRALQMISSSISR
jgi:hypothetical protein